MKNHDKTMRILLRDKFFAAPNWSFMDIANHKTIGTSKNMYRPSGCRYPTQMIKRSVKKVGKRKKRNFEILNFGPIIIAYQNKRRRRFLHFISFSSQIENYVNQNKNCLNPIRDFRANLVLKLLILVWEILNLARNPIRHGKFSIRHGNSSLI